MRDNVDLWYEVGALLQCSNNYAHWSSRLESLLSHSGLSEQDALNKVRRELEASGVKRTSCSCCD